MLIATRVTSRSIAEFVSHCGATFGGVGTLTQAAAAAAAVRHCSSQSSAQDVRAAYEYCAQLVRHGRATIFARHASTSAILLACNALQLCRTCAYVFTPPPPPPAHRQHDAENAIWVGQLRQPLRLRILALRAFNLETLLIGEAVKSKESAVMQIRCVCLPPQRAPCAKGAAAWVMLQACCTCSMSFSPHSCWAPLPPCLTPAGPLPSHPATRCCVTCVITLKGTSGGVTH